MHYELITDLSVVLFHCIKKSIMNNQSVCSAEYIASITVGT